MPKNLEEQGQGLGKSFECRFLIQVRGDDKEDTSNQIIEVLQNDVEGFVKKLKTDKNFLKNSMQLLRFPMISDEVLKIANTLGISANNLVVKINNLVNKFNPLNLDNEDIFDILETLSQQDKKLLYLIIRQNEFSYIKNMAQTTLLMTDFFWENRRCKRKNIMLEYLKKFDPAKIFYNPEQLIALEMDIGFTDFENLNTKILSRKLSSILNHISFEEFKFFAYEYSLLKQTYHSFDLFLLYIIIKLKDPRYLSKELRKLLKDGERIGMQGSYNLILKYR